MIGVPAGPVLSVSEVLEDAQVQEREMIATVRAEGEAINVVTGPAKIDSPKPRPLSYPPELEQHNYGIWGKLGLSRAESDYLKKEGVI